MFFGSTTSLHRLLEGRERPGVEGDRLEGLVVEGDRRLVGVLQRHDVALAGGRRPDPLAIVQAFPRILTHGIPRTEPDAKQYADRAYRRELSIGLKDCAWDT